MKDLLALVAAANPKRTHENITRRLLKATEELGEVSQAYLAVTSKRNRKAKTWDDVREEVADVLIVMVDIALTPLPDREKQSRGEVREALIEEVQRKLAKWQRREPGDLEP